MPFPEPQTISIRQKPMLYISLEPKIIKNWGEQIGLMHYKYMGHKVSDSWVQVFDSCHKQEALVQYPCK